MKKFLLTMFMAVTTAVAMANTYTDNLIVTIDGESTDPQKTTIFVEQNANGTYKLALNNFVLGEDIMVGNIVLDGITATESNGIKSFQTTQEIYITAGEGNEEDWLGPMLGAIPVSLTGKMDAEKLYCTIDIDMSEMLEQIINVVFGSDDFSAGVKYTDNLVVTIDGESTEPQKTTIFVEQNANGTYKLALNNFVLGDMIQVGNIVLDGITATENNGIKSFQTTQEIYITAGEGNEEDWLGPMLGAIPVSLTGKMDAEKLYCTIDIDMSEMLEQIINVVFGSDDFATNNNAVEYTDNLIVTIDGESTDPQETTIFVEQNANGTYKLALNNFVLGDMIQVGNIVLDGITATENNGIKSFQTTQEIYITAGEGNEEDWLGPMLGAIPVSLTGKMDAEKLYCTIDIDMSEMLEQIINVVFGDENAVTSIENIAVENGENVIYDITGRKVKEITNAGIYIVNGKKVFVK